MAEQKPNGSRPSPSASERAVENSASVQRPPEPIPNVASPESPSDRLPIGFPADHTLSVCWPSAASSDACVAEPLAEAADDLVEASSVLQLQAEAVRPQCTEVIVPVDGDEDDSAMMNALGCHSGLPRQHQQFNMDRYGVAPHADGTYATLTPLQPLPPISAVSERLGSGVVVTHGSSGDPHQDAGHNTMHAFSPYSYQQLKPDEVPVCASFQQQQQQLPDISDSRIDSSAFATAQYMRYGQNLGGVSQQVPVCKTEFDNVGKNPSQMAFLGGHSIYANNQLMPAMSGGHVKSEVTRMLHDVDSNTNLCGDVSPHAGCMPTQCQVTSVDQHAALPCRSSSPDQPSSSTDVRHDPEFVSMSALVRHHPSDKSLSCSEEISTRDVALRVSSELKRYSIPQAVFAQRILGRSQGTLSDLLRNPKPWSKLKSGRETFRRMWKWLQEPEYQRMAALRTGQSVLFYYRMALLFDVILSTVSYCIMPVWILFYNIILSSAIYHMILT